MKVKKTNTITHVILNKVNIIKYRGIKCKGLIVYYLKLLKNMETYNFTLNSNIFKIQPLKFY